LAPADPNFNYSSLPHCHNDLKPYEYTPGKAGVCQEGAIHCPRHYICETNPQGNGACCPIRTWKNISQGGCNKYYLNGKEVFGQSSGNEDYFQHFKSIFWRLETVILYVFYYY
jgi:hypothetical protein